MASTLTGMIRQEIEASWLTKLAAIGVIPAFRRARRRMDYAEYGGAPLLGLNGIAIVAHGRSNALAIKNAVRVAAQAVREGVVQQISDGIAELQPTAAGPAAGSATPG
jgi:glycerol-3-phosphate acyltransferase PlsX